MMPLGTGSFGMVLCLKITTGRRFVQSARHDRSDLFHDL